MLVNLLKVKTRTTMPQNAQNASSTNELIGYVHVELTDFCEIWPEC